MNDFGDLGSSSCPSSVMMGGELEDMYIHFTTRYVQFTISVPGMFMFIYMSDNTILEDFDFRVPNSSATRRITP